MTSCIIIEDSPTQAAHLRLMLQHHGLQTHVAHDGRHGLELCRELRPDIVICDVLMPNMNGYEVTRALKCDPATASIPVILATSLTDPADVLQAVEAGADNYVTKPVDEDRLLARVRRALEQPSSLSPSDKVCFGDKEFRLSPGAGPLAHVFLSSLEDAVERTKEAERQKAELTRTNNLREELMRVVAHELRGPLQSLSMRAAVLREFPTRREMIAELPEAIEQQVRSMVRIIDDLSDMTALDLGTMVLDPQPFDLTESVTSVVEEFRLQHAQREVDLETVPGLTVRADPARIRQVISNLLSNAAKYSREGTPIRVRTRRGADHGRVEVEDRGIGIDAEKQSQVFDRYFRVGAAKEQATGVGLGLYICRRILEMHRGSIGLHSEVGHGSTFWFDLPLAS